MNHKKIKRLMVKMGLYALIPKAKYKSYKGDMNGTTKNLLLTKIVYKEKWSTDASDFHIAAGKLYLSPIIDIHNRKIISFNISKSPNFEQTLDMLKHLINIKI